jgi:hypothetical protein
MLWFSMRVSRAGPKNLEARGEIKARGPINTKIVDILIPFYVIFINFI